MRPGTPSRFEQQPWGLILDDGIEETSTDFYCLLLASSSLGVLENAELEQLEILGMLLKMIEGSEDVYKRIVSFGVWRRRRYWILETR